jgi:bifunctional non-homologous end joining protein LigD
MSNDQEKFANLFLREGASDKVYNIALKNTDTGWRVYCLYGRRNKPLKETEKTNEQKEHTYEEALKLFQKTVNGKTRKGYSDDPAGIPFMSSHTKKEASGFRPQLPVSKTLDDVHDLAKRGNFFLQQKHDGERRTVHISKDEIFYSNKLGVKTGSSPIVNDEFSYLLSKAGNVAPVGFKEGNMIFDGEDMGDHIVIFDVVAFEGKDLREEPFLKRASYLQRLKDIIDNNGLTSIKIDIPVDAQEAVSNGWLADLEDRGAEGFILRDGDSPYVSGKDNNGGIYKYKFMESCTARVSHQNVKRSVAVEMLKESGEWVQMGSVTIPPNKEIPEVGSLIEVSYLYAYDNGALFQPKYLGKRFDQTNENCNWEGLKFKTQASDEDQIGARPSM